MPELPEVEVTRRRIEPLLLGRKIARVITSEPSYFYLTPPDQIRRALEGQQFSALERRGKYLITDLQSGQRLLLHLGMTGQLFGSGSSSVRLLSASQRAALSPEEQKSFEPDAHTHLQIHFEDSGPGVLFRDIRKFGKIKLLAAGELEPRLERLGVDALSASAEHLYAAARKRKVAVKNLLLDQSVLAGVGNIYADEALFAAGVRPGRGAGRVTRAECERIARSLVRILERSIETGGSSISDYIAPDGSDGGFQDERRVYGRKDEPCLVCSAPIKRRVIAQRSSHYCALCQR